MKEWIVEQDGNPTSVLIDGTDDTWRCRVGQRLHRAAMIDVTETTIAIVFDGNRPVHADIRWDGDTCRLVIKHIPFTFTVRRTSSSVFRIPYPAKSKGRMTDDGLPATALAEAGRRTTEVRAPMPARVVAVHVKPGETVTAGQPVIVVEAMKMQNELAAPHTGTITAVHVGPGQAVEAHQSLVSITGARVPSIGGSAPAPPTSCAARPGKARASRATTPSTPHVRLREVRTTP